MTKDVCPIHDYDSQSTPSGPLSRSDGGGSTSGKELLCSYLMPARIKFLSESSKESTGGGKRTAVMQMLPTAPSQYLSPPPASRLYCYCFPSHVLFIALDRLLNIFQHLCSFLREVVSVRQSVPSFFLSIAVFE